MQYQLLTAEQYARRLRLLIAESGVLHRRVQRAGGRAVIGWGYSFLRPNNAAIWRDASIDLTAEARACLHRIDEAPAAERAALAQGLDKALTETEANRLLVASSREHEVHAARLGMPRSDERLALVSLTFSRGTQTLADDHPLMAALAAGDRAEAWFQWRYNCWGHAADLEAGLRKRRLMEAAVFGLYDDPAHVGVDEARRVCGMVERHSGEINQVEQRFGQTLAGIEGQRDLIVQANRDYPGIVSTWGEVPTIREALAPAHAALRAAGLPLNGAVPPLPAANDALQQPPRLA